MKTDEYCLWTPTFVPGDQRLFVEPSCNPEEVKIPVAQENMMEMCPFCTKPVMSPEFGKQELKAIVYAVVRMFDESPDRKLLLDRCLMILKTKGFEVQNAELISASDLKGSDEPAQVEP